MRKVWLLVVVLLGGVAIAGPARPARPAHPARNASPRAAPARPATRPTPRHADRHAKRPPAPSCKRVVVGRGRARKVVCTYTAPLVVKTHTPRPRVLIVPHDGRAVTGRPKSGDRLEGLSPRLH